MSPSSMAVLIRYSLGSVGLGLLWVGWPLLVDTGALRFGLLGCILFVLEMVQTPRDPSFSGEPDITLGLSLIVLLVAFCGPVQAAVLAGGVTLICRASFKGASPVFAAFSSCRNAASTFIAGFFYQAVSHAGQAVMPHVGLGFLPQVAFGASYWLLNFLLNRVSSGVLKSETDRDIRRLMWDLANFAIAVPLSVALVSMYAERGPIALAVFIPPLLTGAFVLGLGLRLEATNRELSVLNEVAQRIGSALELERVLDLILASVRRVVNYDVSILYLYDSAKGELNPVVKRGQSVKGSVPAPKCLPIPLGAGTVGKVAETKEGRLISDLSHQTGQLLGCPYPVRSLMLTPLIVEGELLGVLAVGSLRPMAFSDDHLRVLTVLASQASVAIANAIIYRRTEELATTDSMTGLYNYRYLLSRLDDELRKARARELQVSVIYVDIDNFKDYNDTYGHQTGDVILKKFAESLKKYVRESDVAARYGGDEFVIILPGTGYVEACVVARRLQEGIASHEFVVDEVPVHVRLTVSVGVASYPDSGDTTFDLISRADRAMYRSKRQGLDPIYS